MSATSEPVLPPLDIATLVYSFEIALKSARRSPSTLKIYLSSIRLYLQWCADNGHRAQIDRGQVSAWVAAILDGDPPYAFPLMFCRMGWPHAG